MCVCVWPQSVCASSKPVGTDSITTRSVGQDNIIAPPPLSHTLSVTFFLFCLLSGDPMGGCRQTEVAQEGAARTLFGQLLQHAASPPVVVDIIGAQLLPSV